MAKQATELATGSNAKARFVWISPYKVREVSVLIRGKHIDEARRILAFTPKAASSHVAKVLESAVANAEHNHQIPQEELIVKAAWADEGPVFRRAQPRARGARNLIRRRTSHIHVVLEREAAPEAPVVMRPAPATPATVAPPTEKPSRRGRGTAARAPRTRSKPDEKDEEAPKRRRRPSRTKPKASRTKQRSAAGKTVTSRKPRKRGEK